MVPGSMIPSGITGSSRADTLGQFALQLTIETPKYVCCPSLMTYLSLSKTDVVFSISGSMDVCHKVVGARKVSSEGSRLATGGRRITSSVIGKEHPISVCSITLHKYRHA
jgi:hypothetical protein